MLRPECPICHTALSLGSSDGLDRWSCPGGCGLALTLSEAHGRVQDDELALLWQGARGGVPGPLTSPFGDRAMVRVELGFDADEVPDGADGDGADLGRVVVDVDVEEQFIWFDAGELDVLPGDLADAEPTPAQLEAEARIAADFGAAIDSAAEEREADSLTGRLYARIARHPAALGVLDSLGRAATAY